MATDSHMQVHAEDVASETTRRTAEAERQQANGDVPCEYLNS
jgi:hypothetical protein